MRTVLLLGLGLVLLAACGDDTSFPYYLAQDGSGGGEVDTDAGDEDTAADAQTDTADDAEPDGNTDAGDTDAGNTDAGGTDGGACVHACAADSVGCDGLGSAWSCREDDDGCRVRVPVTCGDGTYCAEGVCQCPASVCSARDAGAVCDGDRRVSCVDRNGCMVVDTRTTCEFGCSGGACVSCEPNACERAGRTSGAVCDGDTRVACRASGGCGVVASTEICSAGCAAGACLPPTCGGDGQACCEGACAAGLLCNDTDTCVDGPEVIELRRYATLCEQPISWMSDATCFPGPGPTSACACEPAIVNAGCIDTTCWADVEVISVYAETPAAARFAPLYHCFDDVLNTYQLDTPCAQPGWPHELGAVSRISAPPFEQPVYRCRLFDGEVQVDEFLTEQVGGCADAGYTGDGAPLFFAAGED